MTEAAGRRAVVRIGRWLRARGLVVASDGNISLRRPQGFLITPAGSDKGRLRPASLVAVRPGRARPARPPSTEWRLHRSVYEVRADVGAVIHAHPPALLAFALARKTLRVRAVPELAALVGPVPLVAAHPAGSAALARAAARALRRADVCLLAGHGAVAVGTDLTTAFFRLERAELLGRALLDARRLGR